MEYYQWTIGSTTVRNPNRLRDGLRILKKNFEGGTWDLSQQERFFNLLKQEGIYGIRDDNFDRMTSARKQEHARKWISVLNQLGFCFAYESSGKSVMISSAGEALLNNPELEEEVFLRQLLKYQKPCILPKQNGKAFRKVSILPFIVSLRIIYALDGLSKEEISIFLNTTIRMKDIDNVIEKIKNYREKKSKIKGRVKHKEFYFKTQLARMKEVLKDEIGSREDLIKELFKQAKHSSKFLKSAKGKRLLFEITKGGKGAKTVKAVRIQKDIINIFKKGGDINTAKKAFLNYYLPLKISTLKDYADLTARYLRKSSLFSISRERIVIISDKLELVKSILLHKWELIDNGRYLDYLWDATLPKLPSDNPEYLKKYLKNIARKEKLLFTRVKDKETFEMIGHKAKPARNVLELKQQTKAIERNLLHLKEVEFYHSQGELKQIDDILSYYNLILNKQILGGTAYYPAYLEWNTWRVFLAIDTLLNKPFEARNFKIDDDLQPIDHAPGNRADMVFEYTDFVIVVEVTLSVGPNQWSAEAEPVPRHVAKIQSVKKSKDVFGLFVAPKIDPNTILTFFNSRKYSINNEIIILTIIPFTIEQIKLLLKVFKSKRFSVQKLKSLFETLRERTDKTDNAIGWFEEIPSVIANWCK